MKLTQTLTVVYCVFRVVLCRDFSITLPGTVEAVSGLCVVVPCTFDFPPFFGRRFMEPTKGIWRKDGFEEKHVVFDSSTSEFNQIKGEITGDLRQKNCTTIFTNVTTAHSGTYYFRIEGENVYLRYTYVDSSVSINVVDTPPEPSLSLYVDQKEVQNLKRVMEGSSVNLICSALAPCPSNPPTLTWTPLQPNITQQHQNSSFISSNLSFTASHLHDGQSITCSAAYSLENNEIKTVHVSRLLRVLFSPQISHSSHCNSSDGVILCVCEVWGFPVPKLEWYLSGRPVPPLENSSIREEAMGTEGLRSFFTMRPSTSDTPTLQCVGTNHLGSTTQLLSLVFTDHNQTSLLYLIPTALLFLSLAVNGFLIYKLKQLSTKTKALKVYGDTYATLQLSARESDYETLQTKTGRRLEQCKD